MLIVVTGGAGHIGAHLVAVLLEDGHAVRVVDLQPAPAFVPAGAEWIRADVRDEAAMRHALDRADVVFHLAAAISIVGPRHGLVRSVNVDGTRVVAEAALAAGVHRLVHCSSIHAFDLRASAGGTIDESSPRAIDPGLPAYDLSKAAGEELILRMVRRGLNAVCVNPTAVIGPPDHRPSRMGAMLLALWRRRLPAIVDGGFDWVDVRDTVRGLRLAADRGVAGESYLINGHRLSVLALAELAAACSGTPVTARVAPDWLVRQVAPLATVVARHTMTGTAFMPTIEALHALRCFPTVNGAKARAELGYDPRPAAETLTDLHAYFVRMGQITPRAKTPDNRTA
jgi:dihydroflavonol-4-reductase